MTDLAYFALATALLLFAPGPTNILLAISGAAAGTLRSLRLAFAAMAGYVTVAVVVGTLAGPALLEHVRIRRGLELAAALYLFWLAVRLWRTPLQDSGTPVRVYDVWLTTVLNPKAMLIALVLLPPLQPLAAVGLVTLAGLSLTSGTAWIALGAASGQLGGRTFSRLVPKATSVALVAFAFVIAGAPLLSR